MNFDLREKAKENIIIVAHRGTAGGDIPCNTLASYEIALKQGADMLEVDVSVSADGRLFLFHPLMEHAHLNKPLLLRALPFSVIKKLHYVNADNTPTQFGISSFDDFLEQFKGRCFINIDKFWSNPEKIYRDIKRHNMTDQILVKSKPSEKVFDFMEGFAPELSFMPVVNEKCSCHEELMKRNINYIGIETCFKTDDAPVAQDEFIEKIHADGKLLWANAIIFNHRQQLAGGHSDDTSLTVSEDHGWGHLADKGYDFIQTDWPGMVIEYLKRENKYFKQR